MTDERAALLRDFGEWLHFVTDLGRYGDWLWNQSIAAGKWSVREVVGHILKWDEYFLEGAVAKVGIGQSLTLKHIDYDEFNREAAAYGKEAASGELVNQAVRMRTMIISELSGLTEEQYTAAYKDADGNLFEAAQYIKDFIWHDRHHIGQIRSLLYFRLEEMSLNGWPALQTIVYDGWLLRFSEGYTKRSNSVSPIYGHTIKLTDKIEACERLYKARGIRPVFKMTPFVKPAELDGELTARGYGRIDHTFVKTVHLDQVQLPAHSGIQLEHDLTEEWLAALSGLYGLSEGQREVTRKMMEQSPLAKCFAILREEGVPVACGIAVIEDGWIGLYDIVTSANHRNRGFGEQLILHVLDWGKRQGAKHGYLLVVKENAPANRLYEKIGFVHQYDYWYLVHPE
ncbi:GNAT family N-acetyltransferase [Paenibacillus harenae]|uniref:GNAT family N-acetyltransferase n=1 Tax=Paenibacillus harenae TaxID=306543 RepID=UPI00041F28BC|nr:GNAT family N-acetyltransferase [Paenibacillus harenae]